MNAPGKENRFDHIDAWMFLRLLFLHAMFCFILVINNRVT